MPFLIRYNNKSTYISKLGIVLSLISILTIISLFLYYFIELINHSNFTILINNDKRNEHLINLNIIPMMFGLINSNATLLDLNQEFLNISVWRSTLIPKNNIQMYI